MVKFDKSLAFFNIFPIKILHNTIEENFNDILNGIKNFTMFCVSIEFTEILQAIWKFHLALPHEIFPISNAALWYLYCYYIY